MTNGIAEGDWKFMRSVHDELLATLCERIQSECAAIIASKAGTAHERYLRLFKHIHKADEIVAECFNDWRRSTLAARVCSLNRHGLLTPEHVSRLNPGTREYIKVDESLWKRKK
jgi:hypothetical protein